MEWIEGKYGGATLRFGDGLITLYCDYALVSKGEDNYYYARVNDLKLKKRFKTIDEAKTGALRVAYKLTSLSTEQLKNFIEEE